MNFMYRPNAASYGWYFLVVDCKLSTRYTERNMNADCNIARRSLELRLRVPNHELASSDSTRYKGHLQDDLLEDRDCD
jgi:hypothetical protein